VCGALIALFIIVDCIAGCGGAGGSSSTSGNGNQEGSIVFDNFNKSLMPKGRAFLIPSPLKIILSACFPI